MFTYGYIKEAILSKMDLGESDALEQDLMDAILYNLNECLSQIASTIKPHFSCIQVTVFKDEIPIPEDLLPPTDEEKSETVKEKTEREKKLGEYLKDKELVGNVRRMPKDFIAFSGKSMMQNEIGCTVEGKRIYSQPHEVHDEVAFVGNDKLIFAHPGKYTITYDANWPFFTDTLPDTEEVDIPADIIICLPSYVASQLWKRDDERKAAIYRNEFEIAFSRINNSDYRGNTTFGIEGGW